MPNNTCESPAPFAHQIRPDHIGHEKYHKLRMQLTKLRGRFIRASKLFPASFYKFIEADCSLSLAEWQRWIGENRTPRNLQRERWDIYPYGWAFDHETFELVDADFAKVAGVLISPPATLAAAQAELEHLADTGTKILLAIRDVQKQSPAIEAVVPRPLPEGYRGWLDAVRKTAEVNRGTNLKVEYRLYPGAQDRLSQIIQMGKSLADTRLKGQHSIQFNACRITPVNACRITPDIFSASANAILLWLTGEQDEPVVPLVCPGLTIPKLMSPDVNNQDLSLSPSAASLPDRGDTVRYSREILPPLEWAHIFGERKNEKGSRRFLRNVRRGVYRANRITQRKMQIAIDDLPSTHPESPHFHPRPTSK